MKSKSATHVTAEEAARAHAWSFRLARLLTAAALVVPPLLVWPALADPFNLPKLLAAELLGLASAVVTIVAHRDRVPPLWRQPAVRATAPLLLAAAVSVAASTHRQHGMGALWSLAVGLLCLWAWSLWGERMRRFLDALLLPAFVLSVVGILQFHGLYEPFSFVSGEEQRRVGVTSLAGSVGDLGAFLVLPCLLAQIAVHRTWHATQRSTRRWTPLILAAALVIHYSLVVSQTITALLAVGVGTLVLWLPLVPSRRRWLVPVVGVVVATLLVTTVPPLRSRGRALWRNAEAGRWSTVLSGRTDGWKAATWMFREHPVLGVGLGGFLPAFTPAKLALLDRDATFYRGHRGRSTFRNAHNEGLEVLAETGVVGLLALAWGVWSLIVVLRRRARDETDKAELVFTLGGVASLLVVALGYFPFRLALTAYPAAAFLAWILRPDEAGRSPSDGGGRHWPAWTAAGLLALLLIPEWWRADRLVEASQISRGVELLTAAMNESGRESRALVYGQIRALKKARQLAPADVSIPLALGGEYLQLGDGDEATRWLEVALELEPRPEVYSALASALELAGRREEAERSRSTAARLDPRTYGSS